MPYTLLFFASSDIALPLLHAIAADNRFQLIGLVCQPDKPGGRGMEIEVPPVKHIAEKLGIPVYQPEKLSSDMGLLAMLQEARPDFLLSFAYGQYIPKVWLSLPKIAPLNVHPSLLPLYRGPSPIQFALLNGDIQTGVTLMKMIKEMDAGPIVQQVIHPIPTHATTSTLFDDLGELSAHFVPDAMIKLANEGESILVIQDHSKATMTKKIEKEDGRVDFQKSAEEIFRKFRAYTPWPGIFTEYQGQRLKLCEIEPSNEVLLPGQVRCDKHFIHIGTSDGSIKVKQLQLEGKKVLYVESFILGQAEFCSAFLPS